MQSSISLARLIGLGAVLAVVPVAVHAQDNDDGWNHFGLNARAGFNIRARFSDPSSGGALPPPPSAGADVNRQYNDGYVDVDSSHNANGQTWNWGYHNASQIVEGEGDSVVFHATGGAGGSISKTDDPNLGIDFNYMRDLGHETWGRWGIKFAFGYTHVQIDDDDPISGAAQSIADEYFLGNSVPPTAPYSGSFSGPGTVLDTPGTRISSTSTSGITTGTHDIDAALYDLRIGPSVNIPLGSGFSFEAGGGLALGIVDSDFTFVEHSGSTTTLGGNTRTDLLPGGFGEIGFAYKFCHSASIFTGAQYEYLGTFDQNAGGRTAHLDFGATIFYELGLEWHF